MLIGALLCGVSYFITEPVTLGIVSSVLTVLLFNRQILKLYDGQKHKDIEEIK